MRSVNGFRIARRAGLVAMAVWMGAGTSASAGSFYLQEQSVRGAGRAYSGEAADTGASSLWWNAAAIARSGPEIYLGAHSLNFDSGLEDTGSALTFALPAPSPPFPAGSILSGDAPVPGNHNAEDILRGAIAPNLGFAWPVSDRVTLGLALQAPYNTTTLYEGGDFARFSAMKTHLRSVNVDMVAAMQVTDWFDIGVGLDARYAWETLTVALPNLPTVASVSPVEFIPAAAEGRNELEGNGWNYGWNAGVQMHFARWDFGLGYRSSVEQELEGSQTISGLEGSLAFANQSVDGSIIFTTPWHAAVSARHKLTDRLTANIEVNRIGWSEFNDYHTIYGGVTTPLPQGYKDITTGAIGVDFDLLSDLTVRAGISYEPTPTPEGRRSARSPDGDRLVFAAGLSRQWRHGLTFDAGLGYLDMNDNAVHDVRTYYGGLAASEVNGVTTGKGLDISLGLRWKL